MAEKSQTSAKAKASVKNVIKIAIGELKKKRKKKGRKRVKKPTPQQELITQTLGNFRNLASSAPPTNPFNYGVGRDVRDVQVGQTRLTGQVGALTGQFGAIRTDLAGVSRDLARTRRQLGEEQATVRDYLTGIQLESRGVYRDVQQDIEGLRQEMTKTRQERIRDQRRMEEERQKNPPKPEPFTTPFKQAQGGGGMSEEELRLQRMAQDIEDKKRLKKTAEEKAKIDKNIGAYVEVYQQVRGSPPTDDQLAIMEVDPDQLRRATEALRVQKEEMEGKKEAIITAILKAQELLDVKSKFTKEDLMRRDPVALSALLANFVNQSRQMVAEMTPIKGKPAPVPLLLQQGGGEEAQQPQSFLKRFAITSGGAGRKKPSFDEARARRDLEANTQSKAGRGTSGKLTRPKLIALLEALGADASQYYTKTGKTRSTVTPVSLIDRAVSVAKEQGISNDEFFAYIEQAKAFNPLAPTASQTETGGTLLLTAGGEPAYSDRQLRQFYEEPFSARNIEYDAQDEARGFYDNMLRQMGEPVVEGGSDPTLGYDRVREAGERQGISPERFEEIAFSALEETRLGEEKKEEA